MIFKKKIAAIALVSTLSMSVVPCVNAYAADSDLSFLSNDSATTVAQTPTDTTTSPNDSTTNPTTNSSTAPEASASSAEQQENASDQTQAVAVQPQDQTDDSTVEDPASTNEASDSAEDAGSGSIVATQAQANTKDSKKKLFKPISYIFGVVMGVVLFLIGKLLLFIVRNKRWNSR